MKLKLHIHFGIHRTGTTSIHKNLLENIDLLNSKNILYPNLDVGHNHVQMAWKLISKKIKPVDLVKLLEKEVNENTNQIILSSEDFSLLDENWLQVLSETFILSGSIYLRRQDLWLESWYNQHIRWPWDKKLSSSTPSEFLESMNSFYWLDYNKLLTMITKVIPKENMYVNTLERKAVSDTTLDFFKQFDIDISKINFLKRSNESISSIQIDLIRRINLIDFSGKERQKVLKALNALDIKEDNGSKIVFKDQEVDEILEKYRESNKKIAQEYFGRDELFFDEVKYGRVPKFLSDERAYEIYIPALLKGIVKL